MLLLLNRMVPGDSLDWARWLVFLAMGGFFGNFVLSLTDHAGNGFFHWTEWIPVVSSSFAVAFLAVFFVAPLTPAVSNGLRGCAAGAGRGGRRRFRVSPGGGSPRPSRSFFQNVVDGAPPFAPLLLPNLMILGVIGLWVVGRKVELEAGSWKPE